VEYEIARFLPDEALRIVIAQKSKPTPGANRLLHPAFLYSRRFGKVAFFDKNWHFLQ